MEEYLAKQHETYNLRTIEEWATHLAELKESVTKEDQYIKSNVDIVQLQKYVEACNHLPLNFSKSYIVFQEQAKIMIRDIQVAKDTNNECLLCPSCCATNQSEISGPIMDKVRLAIKNKTVSPSEKKHLIDYFNYMWKEHRYQDNNRFYFQRRYFGIVLPALNAYTPMSFDDEIIHEV